MSKSNKPALPAKSQFLRYQTEDGRFKIDVRLENETAWLTQAHMAELFQTTVPNVNMHLRNIYAEGELQAAAAIQEFLIVRAEGARQVSRTLAELTVAATIREFRIVRQQGRRSLARNVDQYKFGALAGCFC